MQGGRGESKGPPGGEFRPYPPTQKATAFEAGDECVEGTLRSSYERSGVCFGGFRPTKQAEEPRLRAVTHFGVQARASARGGSTAGGLNRAITGYGR